MAIALIFLTHIIIFISYPDTTPLGPSYMFISFIISTAFYYLIKPKLLVQIPIISSFLKLLMWLILFITILINYPQKDSKSVMYKIYQGQLPTRLTIYRGFKKLGIELNFILMR
ncbi:MAG: hypothetical protein N2Z20_03660 [Elusimicrobiales bacterium]|nr:hypothetical protein [Elusimicrobiales bacterium]